MPPAGWRKNGAAPSAPSPLPPPSQIDSPERCRGVQETVVTAQAVRGTGEARMLDACAHRQPDCTPVWFMRQAGRCLAEYRQLREKHGILEIAKTPELSAQVTLMPIAA